MGHFPTSGGGGAGTIDEITSVDTSVTVTDPFGPVADLAVNGSLLPVTGITSVDGTVKVAGSPIFDLSVGRNTNQLFVDDFGADPTGATFSDAAFAAAQTAGGAKYQLVMGVGTYKLATGLTFIRNQSLIGQGSAMTTVNWTGAGACIAQVDSSFNAFSSIAGPMTGFTVTTTSSAGRIGLQYGDMLGIVNTDLVFVGFLGAGSIGYYGHNVAGWSEHGVHQVRVFDSTDCFVWDTGSFDYSFFNFYANIFAGTPGNGLTGRNGVQAVGVTLILNANCGVQSANANYLIGWDPAGGGIGTSVFQGLINVQAETDGTVGSGPFTGYTGHIPIKMDSGACDFNAMGMFRGLQGGAGATASAKWGASAIPGNANFTITGRLDINEVTPQLGVMIQGDAQVTWGVSAQKALAHAGNLSGAMFLNGGGVHVYNLGATEAFSVGGGLTTTEPTQKSWDLYFVCNNAGGCAATWTGLPGGAPLFAAGVPPTFSSVVGQIDHLRLTWLPTIGQCLVEVISYGGNPVRTVSTTQAVLASDVILLASGTTTLTLPTAVGISGKQYTVKKTDAVGTSITMATTSAQTIDGAATNVISIQYTSITMVSDGANWNLI